MGVFTKQYYGVDYWYYRFEYQGRKRQGPIAPADQIDRAEALRQEKIKKGEAAADTYDMEKAKSKPLSHRRVVTEYMQYLKTHRPKTYKSVQYIEDTLRWFQRFDRIGPAEIVKYQEKRLGDGKSRGTINRELQYLSAAYNRADPTKTPFLKADFFKEHARVRSLTEKELVALLRRSQTSQNKFLPLIITTAIVTGLRKQELLRLHLNRLNPDRGTITIDAVDEKSGKHKEIGVPQLDLNRLHELGKAHHSGYVFENPKTGKPFGDVKNGFRKACTDAKIDDFRFHDLRHTFATYALILNKDIRVVQEIMGHSRLRTTQKYTHVLNESKRAVADSMGDFLTALLNKSVEDEKEKEQDAKN
jgi:integrase